MVYEGSEQVLDESSSDLKKSGVRSDESRTRCTAEQKVEILREREQPDVTVSEPGPSFRACAPSLSAFVSIS
jgi:hypothetical protein